MTLLELRKIKSVLELTLASVAKLQETLSVDITEAREIKESVEIIDREIKLKTIDPRNGREYD